MNKRIIYICLTLSSLFSLFFIEASAQNVNIKFTVTGKDKNADVKLNAEDIRILVDGKVQPVISLQKFDEQPFALVMMFDVSLSQERILESTKIAGDEFVRTVARSDKDKLAVIGFAGNINNESILTNNIGQIRQTIQNLKITIPQGYIGCNKNVAVQTPSTATAIWDSLYYVSNNLLGEKLSHSNKAIIIFTDGTDTFSKTKLKDVITNLIKSGVKVYTIGVADDEFAGVEKSVLRQLAEKTGGLAFTPKKLQEISTAYREIEQSLRSFYIASIAASAGDEKAKIRKVKIEIINPELRKQNLQINCNEGYFVGETK